LKLEVAAGAAVAAAPGATEAAGAAVAAEAAGLDAAVG